MIEGDPDNVPTALLDKSDVVDCDTDAVTDVKGLFETIVELLPALEPDGHCDIEALPETVVEIVSALEADGHCDTEALPDTVVEIVPAVEADGVLDTDVESLPDTEIDLEYVAVKLAIDVVGYTVAEGFAVVIPEPVALTDEISVIVTEMLGVPELEALCESEIDTDVDTDSDKLLRELGESVVLVDGLGDVLTL